MIAPIAAMEPEARIKLREPLNKEKKASVPGRHRRKACETLTGGDAVAALMRISGSADREKEKIQEKKYKAKPADREKEKIQEKNTRSSPQIAKKKNIPDKRCKRKKFPDKRKQKN